MLAQALALSEAILLHDLMGHRPSGGHTRALHDLPVPSQHVPCSHNAHQLSLYIKAQCLTAVY